MSDLRTAAQQALEALETNRYAVANQAPHLDVMEYNAAITALRAALAQQDEPVAWMEPPHGAIRANPNYKFTFPSQLLHWQIPLYTAPPQRLPLTDEEILKAIGWERAEMYMKLTPNFPVAEAKKETLKNARAIERQVWTGPWELEGVPCEMRIPMEDIHETRRHESPAKSIRLVGTVGSRASDAKRVGRADRNG